MRKIKGWILVKFNLIFAKNILNFLKLHKKKFNLNFDSIHPLHKISIRLIFDLNFQI